MQEFISNFDDISTCKFDYPLIIIVDILLKLRAEGDPNFKVDFHVNFTQIELIARDMQHVKEYDFELVVFKFEGNCFFTTKSLFHKLQETVLYQGLTLFIEFDNDEHPRLQNAVL